MAWRKCVLALLVSLLTANYTSALSCGDTDIWGSGSSSFYCPRPEDPSDAAFCCGQGSNQGARCCNIDQVDHGGLVDGTNNAIGDLGGEKRDEDLTQEEWDKLPKLSDAKAEKRSIVMGLAKLVGIVIGAFIFVCIVAVVCCCCCPFCLLAKKRQRGEVLRRGADQGAANLPQQQQYQPAPQQPLIQQPHPPQGNQGYPPPQAGYPPSQAGYPPQQMGYPPQQGYPLPDMSQQYLPQGYPAAPPPYSGPPPQDVQAPPLSKDAYQSQPAYNPGY